MIQYSQRDSHWANERLGFGEDGLTIGNYGCLLTACATVLTYHGYPVDPSQLNKKLKAVNGFQGALMYVSSLHSIYPVAVQLHHCENEAAPLQIINKSLDEGRPVIVELDYSPQQGFQNHWVTIYKREGNKYYISDPWTYFPDKETVTLEDRFGFAGKNEKIITQVLFLAPLENNRPVAQPQPSDVEPVEALPVPTGKKMRVLADGLRLRNGASITATELTLLGAGVELISAGDLVPDGEITWQPVVLYVAAKNGNNLYVQPVK